MEDIDLSYASGDQLHATTLECHRTRNSTASEHGKCARGGSNGTESPYSVPKSIEATTEDPSILNSDVKATYFQVPTSTSTKNVYQSTSHVGSGAAEKVYSKIDCLSAEVKSPYSLPQLLSQERVLDTSKVSSDEQETYFQVPSAKTTDSHYQSLGKAPFSRSTSAKARRSKDSPDLNPQSSRRSHPVIPLK